MVLRITESQKAQILNLHHSGHTNDEIYNITKISTGSISSIITNYIQSLESEDHDSIISLSRSWRKNDLSLKDASIAMSVCGIFKKNNIDIDNLPEISKIFSYIDEKKITLTEFVDSSNQLKNIQNKSDTPLLEIPQKMADIQKKYESLKEKSEKLEKDITLQEKALQNSIGVKNTTIKQLNEFTETRDFLIKSDIDVKNYEKFANMIKSADIQKYDLSEITANLQKENSVSERIIQLESKEDKLLVEIKSKEDIITKKQSQMSHLASKYDTISKDHDKKSKEIANIKSLTKSGVSHLDIKSWNKIVSEASMDISKLAESIDIIKQLSNTIQSLKGKVYSLKNDTAALQGEKSQLDIQVKKLKAQQDVMLKLGGKIKQIVSDANSYALNNMHDLSQKVFQNYSKDVKESSTQLEQRANQLALQLEQRVNELLSQDEKMIQHAKILNDVNFLRPMYEIIIGKYNYPKSEVLATYATITSALINWCISEKISHTPFAKSLEKIDVSMKLLLSGTSAA
jgi:myosin heavy subunit